jgi:hypothetical protein
LGSLTKARLDRNFAAMSLRQMFDYGQPQACAAKFARTGSVNPIEALEQAIEMVRGNSLAGV